MYTAAVPESFTDHTHAGRPAPLGAPETVTAETARFSSKGWHVIFENGGVCPAYISYPGPAIENWHDGRSWEVVRADSDKRVLWAKVRA